MTNGTPADGQRPPIRTANLILYCRHWVQTVHFYREALALPVLFESEWLVELELNAGARLSVADAARTSIPSAGGAGITVTLEVEDAAAGRAWLLARGIEATPLKRHRWGAHVCYFRDPEGNRLEIWSPLAEPGR